MKKVMFMALAAFALVAASCVKEDTNNMNENNEPSVQRPANIRLTQSSATKAHMEDNLGLIWDAGDVIAFHYYHAGEPNAYWNTSYTLEDADITNNGYDAVFKGNLDAGNLLGLFRYNTNGGNEVYFTDTEKGTLAANAYTFTQSEAGLMNKSQIHLHSGIACVNVDNSADADVQDIPMEIMGTVFRLMPYTTSYNSETITSVAFSSNSRITGCVRYHYGSDIFYDSINDVNWNTAKSVIVNLGTGYSLSGATSKDTSKGIYFSLPATEAGVSEIIGYSIKVTTDAAVYYFDSSRVLTVGNNKVKNIYLDLKNATRVADGSTTGSYWFDGTLAGSYPGKAINVPAAGLANDESQYWLAYTNVGGAVDARYPNTDPDFYSKTAIVIRDAEGNTPDWVTLAWKPDSHFMRLNVLPNTSSDARVAKITILPPSHVGTFDLRANEPCKEITLTQAGDVTFTPVLSDFSSTTAVKGGSVITATIGLEIGGTPATTEQFNTYIGEVSISADNAKVTRSGSTLTIYVGVNPLATSRSITITAAYNEESDSQIITQDANDADIPQTFSYAFAGWQNDFDATGRQLNFSSAAESGAGHWVCVLVDVYKNGVRYTSDMPNEDKADFIKYVLQLSDDEYTELTSWITFDVTGGAGEVKIIITDRTANTTGSQKVFTGYLYLSDLSKIKQLLILRQDA